MGSGNCDPHTSGRYCDFHHAQDSGIYRRGLSCHNRHPWNIGLPFLIYNRHQKLMETKQQSFEIAALLFSIKIKIIITAYLPERKEQRDFAGFQNFHYAR